MSVVGCEQIAFNELNPFPMKLITVKRQLHMQQLKVTDCLLQLIAALLIAIIIIIRAVELTR